ncbi:MAG: L-serine ammonia-lyase, iron-sulfur-dependent, subunit alpha, partial [Bacteroidales bacterium]
NEVKPALGCTEPIAVALAVATAAQLLKTNGEIPTKIEIEVSANILKNGMGVGIPGTKEVGLFVASALGAICGEPSLSLELLRGVNNHCIEKALEMVNRELVTISKASSNSKKLFIKATLYYKESIATATIEDRHDNISSLTLNGKRIPPPLATAIEEEGSINGNNSRESYLNMESIYSFAKEVEFEKIEFILESVRLNTLLAEEGLSGEWGLGVGRSINSASNKRIYGDSILREAMALTAAASDARMSGSTLPAMSNSGSGNQGITVTLPVAAYAKKIGANSQKLARALVIAHLTASLLKVELGKLSALCGCVTAATGASCAIVYLEGGALKEIEYAIHNMVGNITGMVCDGAKPGCALKVATGVAAAIKSATLALEGRSITKNEGIVTGSVEGSIRNLSKIGSEGMNYTDKLILEMMLNK